MIALQSGRTEDAIRMLKHSCATFARAKFRWEELWTRIVLARALAADGHMDAAALELATAAADAERTGIAVIARVARQTHVELRLPGTALPRATPTRSVTAAHEPGSRTPGAAVTVVATAMSAAPTDRWRAWGAREAQRQAGSMIGAPDALTATFSVADEDDTWTRALRFAFGLRAKGALLDMPVRAGVSATVADAASLLAAADANDILTSEAMSDQARIWLDARQLTDRRAI